MTDLSDIDLSSVDQRRDIVRAVWQEVLQITEVDDDSTFFDMGGDSLRLAMLVEKLNQRTGLSLRTVDFFRAGTVRGHAELLVASPTRTPGLRGYSREQLLDAARSGQGSRFPRP